MSQRSIQLNDYVIITDDIHPDKYIIFSIQLDGIYIHPINQPNTFKKLIQIDNEWKIFKNTPHLHQITFLANPDLPSTNIIPSTNIPQIDNIGLTGIVGVDINILRQLDDKFLSRACSVNKYMISIYRGNQLWKAKVVNQFHGAERFKQIISPYNDQIGWKTYYIDLTKIECNRDGITVLVKNKRLDLLQYVHLVNPFMLPDQNDVNIAAENGDIEMLEWLTHVSSDGIIEPIIIPNIDGANSAAEHGHVNILNWLESIPKPLGPILPNIQGIEKIVRNGQIISLQWMVEHSIIKDFSNISNIAVINGRFEILKWFESMDPPILPTKFSVYLVIKRGYLDILKWYLELSGNDVISSVYNANIAATYGRLDILKYMTGLNPPIYPSIGGINGAATSGHLDVLKWAKELLPPRGPLIPSVFYVDTIAKGGHTNILQWLISGDLQKYPTNHGANLAISGGHLQTFEWFIDHNIYPTISKIVFDNENSIHILPEVIELLNKHQIDLTELELTTNMANIAATYGDLKTLQYLFEQNPPIVPNQKGIDDVVKYGEFSIFQWLLTISTHFASLNKVYTISIYPDVLIEALNIGTIKLPMIQLLASLQIPNIPITLDTNIANSAAKNGDLDILQWLESLNPPILPTKLGYIEAVKNGYFGVVRWLESISILEDDESE